MNNKKSAQRPFVPRSSKTKYGRAFGRGWLFVSKSENPPQVILEAIKRLKLAGIFVPEVNLTRTNILYSRLGSKRRPFRENNLAQYVVDHYTAVENGKRPNISRLTFLLNKYASVVARAEIGGVVHNHPHFGNIIVLKSNVGLIDYSRVQLLKIKWDNPLWMYGQLKGDLAWLSNSFVEISYFFKSVEIKRSLMRRRAQCFDKLISKYPMTTEHKTELKMLLNNDYRIWDKEFTSGKYWKGGDW